MQINSSKLVNFKPKQASVPKIKLTLQGSLDVYDNVLERLVEYNE